MTSRPPSDPVAACERPPSSAEAPSVDLFPLHDIAGDDAAIAEEIVHDLAESAADLLARSEGALGVDDALSLTRLAHTLKGSSGIIGATSLRRCAEAIERAAVACDLATARSRVADARRLLPATTAILRAEIERMRGA